ncbi:hypothetical protein EPI10_027626 [Gossypium australe]|uniref:Uncharacterized protein n=1 Tax=Gossypium australe TaxID=47621 RepID=A0A5B6UUR6_9ROSI|nr:hypothetical protein EPI10_027626 [Gossypium australe]
MVYLVFWCFVDTRRLVTSLHMSTAYQLEKGGQTKKSDRRTSPSSYPLLNGGTTLSTIQLLGPHPMRLCMGRSYPTIYHIWLATFLWIQWTMAFNRGKQQGNSLSFT